MCATPSRDSKCLNTSQSVTKKEDMSREVLICMQNILVLFFTVAPTDILKSKLKDSILLH